MAASLFATVIACGPREVTAGFWFEPVTYESKLLGVLTPVDLATVERIARAELAIAYQPFRVTLTDRRDARYRVRVVQELLDERLERGGWVAGQAFGTRAFGGWGAVSFVYFAQGAQAYAPPQSTRAELVEAIGRGIGRSAAHEFAHLFLAGATEPETRDQASYEYHAASRPEQYFGAMHWDTAGPMLEQRLGARTAAPAPDDERLIRDARAASNQAIAAHDLAGIARHWMPDVHVVSSTSAQTGGSEANRQRMARQFETRPDTVYVRTPVTIEIYSPWNVASERGEWVGRWTEPDGALEIGGTYQAQWRKVDGRWLIQAELYVPTRCRGGDYCKRRP